jgi:acyl-CoA thioester hydrolase
MEVRDYELDAQGIVNNASYLHYFEHARHQAFRSCGVDFVGMHDAGLDAVVYRIEIDYRESLRSGDRFEVTVVLSREGRLRLIAEQELVKEGGALSARARVEAAIVTKGRPVPPPAEFIEKLLG